MRTARFSITAQAQLRSLLADGEPFYSREFLEFQATRAPASVARYLLDFPEMQRIDPILGLRLHFIDHTPFCLAYDFDDEEVRIHSVYHRHAHRQPTDIRW